MMITNDLGLCQRLRLACPSSILALLVVALTASGGQSQTPAGDAPKVAPSAATASEASMRARASSVFAQLPLRFEKNEGQAESHVKFVSRNGTYSLFLAPNEAILALAHAKGLTRNGKTSGAAVHLQLVGANPDPVVTGVEELSAKSNYFVGNDPTKWHSRIPNYARVRYQQIYPGIDLDYYGNQGGLEYDFVVAPGADASHIRFEIAGERSLSASVRLVLDGDLLVKVGGEEIRLKKPVAYQPADSPTGVGKSRKEISGNFVLEPSNRVSFELGAYDHSKQLIIDPAITYMSYVGGGRDHRVTSVAVGQDLGSNDDFLYVAGFTTNPLLPVTSNAQQASFVGDYGNFIAKIDPSLSGASSLVYLSYFGGVNGPDQVSAIAADHSGNVYLTGFASSDSFPQVQPLVAGLGSVQSAFLTKLNSDGSNIVFSTRFGGTHRVSQVGPSFASTVGSAIAIDGFGNAYIGGSTNTSDLPLVNPFHTGGGGFVAGFRTNPTPAISYATYVGDFDLLLNDHGVWGLALGPGGTVYVVGSGIATPTINGFQGQGGGFFLKFNPDAPSNGQILYSTRTDAASAVAVDVSGNAYITGGAFALKVNPSAVGQPSLIYANAAFSGGGGGSAITVDPSGNAYIAGTTSSNNFPLVNPVQASMYGVSQSVDGGKTWAALSNGLPFTSIFDLTVDTSTSPHNLYAITQPFDFLAVPRPEVTPPATNLFKSSDGGLNWRSSNAGLEGRWTTAVSIDPSNNSVLYAATSAGVYRSTDQGSTWVPFNPGSSGLASEFVTSVAGDSSTLYAGTLSGLYVLRGGNWTRSNLPIGADHITIDPNVNLTSFDHDVYASFSGSYGGFPEVWRSSDLGTTWTQLGDYQINDSSYQLSMVVLDGRTSPSTLYALANNSINPTLFKSVDSGIHWSYVSDTGGLLNGGNGGFDRIAIDTSTTPPTLYASDFSNGLYRSVDGGVNWLLILAGPTVAVVIDPTTASSTTPSTVYAANYANFANNGFLAKLNPDGSNLLFSTLISGVRGLSVISSLARDSNGTLYVGGSSDSSYLPTVNAFEPVSLVTNSPYQTRTGFVAAIGDAQLAVAQACTTCSASTQVNVPNGTLSVSLPNVSGSSTGGTPTLSVTQLAASDTANFSLSNNLGAYDISTTATYSASASNPVTLCFQAQTVNDPTTFSGLRLIHIVNGSPVDSTSSRDFPTRTVCGSVTSLSPFILINGTPSVSWSAPQHIIYGAKLSSTQLNATASVPGTFTYFPAAGSVLPPGQQTISVTFMSDNPALYSSVTKSVQINVSYSTASCNGDAGHSILQPINSDGSSVFKLGSTVPTKFRVCDANGASVGLAGTVVSYTLIAAGATSGLTVDEDSYSTNADNAFRWDSTGKQWLFNQATGKNNPTLSKTNTIYRFQITLKDGSAIQFQYGLK